MEEIREILQVITGSTQATTSAAEAVKKAVEDKKSSTGWSKLIAKPNILGYKSQEEEIKAFRERSWVFEKLMSSVDEVYMKDMTTEEWIASFIDEGKSAAIGESCRGLQWICCRGLQWI